MVNFNANVGGALSSVKGLYGPNSVLPKANPESFGMPQVGGADAKKSNFANAVKAIENCVSGIDDLQQSSDMAIKDLLSGKNQDINSVVSAVAKADMSFKLLVGVRNKLIEAYKQTMNMPV